GPLLAAGIQSNRSVLRETLCASAALAPASEYSTLSVEWCFLTSGVAAKFVAESDSRGVALLPGNHFFWADRCRGNAFIRIALARPRELFEQACRVLAVILDGYP